jgi:hypothetical protein
MKITTQIKKALGLFNYGIMCHGYDEKGNWAHDYRCRDETCPKRLAYNEFFNKYTGKAQFTKNGESAQQYDRRTAEQHKALMDAGCI